jgi:hypothetical protein
MITFRKFFQNTKHLAGMVAIRIICHFRAPKFSLPPVVLLSYPRSGSSWAGKILATSRQFAYLREPITQPYMKIYGGLRPVFLTEDDHPDITTYKRLADNAFAGRPSLNKGGVDNKNDFLPFSKNILKRLLIKEVNPAAADFFCKRYEPFLLLLLRHPAAVALSYYEQGWLKNVGSNNFDEWVSFGRLYGTFMADAVSTASNYENSKIIKYEELVKDPRQSFLDIFNCCNVEAPEDFDAVIEKYCHAKNDVSSGYQTQRNSKLTSEKWKNKLNAEQLVSLRKGFLESKLEFYKDPSDWMV